VDVPPYKVTVSDVMKIGDISVRRLKGKWQSFVRLILKIIDTTVTRYGDTKGDQ